MVTHTLKNLPKNTLEIDVAIPADEIKVASEKAFDVLHTQLELKGFRKGKVPRDMAKKHVQSDAVYSQMLRDLLPTIYEDIVKKESLKPIVSPKVELIKAKEGEAWEIKFTTALKPTVDVANYKEVVAKVKAEAKKNDIWVPGKDQKQAEASEASEADQNENHQKLLNSILDGLIKGSKVEISELILEDEVNRRLSQLVDDVQRIGLTTDAYLKSKNTTMDELKARYTKEIEDTYKLEFILAEIADKAGIKVEQADLDKLFAGVKDDKEREAAQANAYMYASVLRKQKTLDYLVSL